MLLFPEVKSISLVYYIIFIFIFWGNTNRIESHVLDWLHLQDLSGQGWYIGSANIFRKSHASYIQVRAGTSVGTRLSHSGQGWYISRHSHLTFRSGLVHRDRHTHLTFRSGLVHRLALTSHVQVRAGTSVGTHISLVHRSALTSHIQVRAGTSVGTHISHSGQGWYIGRHSHLIFRSGLVHRERRGDWIYLFDIKFKAYCRTGKFRDRKFSRFSAPSNSRAGNFREFLDSWGPQLSNGGFGLKIGPFIREIHPKTSRHHALSNFHDLQYTW